jgi:acyl carrier protein
VADLDLQEQTRRDDAYVQLNKLIDGLQEVNAFPPLVWLWVWDMVKSRLDLYSEPSQEELVLNSNLSEKDVFDMFWEDADKNQFSLEYGLDSLDEAILDWMLERDILIEIEEEDWIDE